MQPRQLKGFTYAPIAFQQAQDPWADLRKKMELANRPQKGRGGFLSSIISELGGAGGAATGAAAGAAAGSVVPVLGTAIGGVVGAGIGGLIGGFGGRAVENKVRDNQNLLGKGGSFKTAAGEGALSGALGALGTGVSAARGIKAAGGVSELRGLTNSSDDLTKAILKGGKKAGMTIANETPNIGRLASGATRLESRALGFGQGEKIAGKQVRPKDIQDLFQVMKSEGIKAGHPDVVGRQVESKLSKVGLGIDSALTKANRPLTKAEQGFLSKGFSREVSDNIVLANNPSAQKLANSLNKQFKGINSLEDIVKGRRNIQEAINFARNSTAATPGTEEVLRAAQSNLNKLAGSISPELKALNGRYASLSKLEEATLNASKSLTSQSRSAMGGIAGNLKAGDSATALKARLGATGRAVGGGIDSLSSGLTGAILKGGAVRGIAGNALMPSAPIEQPQPLDTEGLSPDTPDGMTGLGGLDSGQPVQPAMTLQEALMQAQQLLGNDATPAQYLSYAKAFMDAGQGQGLDANQRKASSQVNSALSIVDQLQGLYSKAGAAQGFKGYVTKLTSKTPINSAQKSFTDQRSGYISRIVRALGEVGTLNEGDIQRAIALIPDYTDTPESAQSKWDGLRQVLNSFKQSTLNSPQSQQQISPEVLMQGGYQ